MNLGSVLLVNVLCVAGGILLYDTLRSDAPQPVEYGGAEPAPGDAAPAPDPGPAATLDSGTTDAIARSNARRLAALESGMAELRRLAGRAADARLRTGDGGGVLDAAPGGGTIDEETLSAISTYVEEIERRKGEERRRQQLRRVFERKGVVLTEDERRGVLDALIRFQRDVTALRADIKPGDPQAMQDLSAAQKALQEKLHRRILDLVSEANAEKILGTQLGRGMPNTGFGQVGAAGDD